MAVWRRAVVVAIVSGAIVSAASAGGTLRPAAGASDPKLMVLVSADLSGAAVTNQGYYKDEDFPSTISYTREFEDGAVGSTDLLAVQSDAEVGTSAQSTTQFIAEARRVFGSREFREVLKDSFEEEVGDGGEISNLVVGRPGPLGGGLDGFDLRMSFRVLGKRVESHITVFRVERVLGLLLTMGGPGERVSLAVPRRLAGVMAARMRTELSPVATRVPAISGVAREGQVLTASRGAWIHKPTGYAYEWRRCDAAGETCSPIPGATAATYTLSSADVGSTVRVAVTARNAVGSATAVSSQTAVVAPAAPPANTAPPAITGLAQQGQTLTGSTGTWSGNPSGFAFQWERCDAAATACTVIPAATGQTYVVGAGDVGFRLRLAVTATNAAGATTAVSVPTDVIP